MTTANVTTDQRMSRTEAFRRGIDAARLGWHGIARNATHPHADPIDERNRLAYRSGYAAEMTRINNRRSTPEQREFLAAHDEAARAWADGVGPDGCIVREAAKFAAAQKALYATIPWAVLGIKLSDWASPNRQAYGR